MGRAINRTAIGTVARAAIDAIEPWYDWGRIGVERMESLRRPNSHRWRGAVFRAAMALHPHRHSNRPHAEGDPLIWATQFTGGGASRPYL